ncbi:MAG: hypothetical protein QNJ22_21190 [Desulfosarcinaceae bacterium]|nr:hypothetical protein [Desulfosarcinaceae bacterium]
MRRHDTINSSPKLPALLLVWAIGMTALGTAHAESHASRNAAWQVDGQSTIQAAAVQSPGFDNDLEPDMRHGDPTFGFEETSSRADLYTLAKLAVDELEFLAGIRLLWNQAERQFDRVALKLKLKGDISLDSGDRLRDPPPVGTELLRPASSLSPSRHDRLRHQLSLQSLLLPRKIRWHFGLDPTDHVLFGELKWGRFLALQSDLGAHQEVKLVFQYDF